MLQKRKVIGIMGSSKQSYRELSVPLAQWIARQNYHLITGGGGGVMAAAAEAFCGVEERKGISIGVLPTELDNTGRYTPLDGYPNLWVELAIASPLSRFDPNHKEQLSRNYICVLSSDLIVALPGNKGTKNEVELALRFDKPIILYGWQNRASSFSQSVVKTNSLDRVIDFIQIG